MCVFPTTSKYINVLRVKIIRKVDSPRSAKQHFIKYQAEVMEKAPKDIQIIAAELAILWEDGREDYIPHEFLRANSPSAENIGERDIMGNKYGGDGPTEFPNVRVTGWSFSGNYAVILQFSDGHNSGIYSWQFLKKLGDVLKEKK
jgi:DUF971 family protein